MRLSLWSLFTTFLKIGALLFGGGYVIVPLLQSELVEKRNWINKEELLNYYALAQCVPGIIAANTALFIGYKLRGKTGTLCAFLGLIIPPFFAIILLASILDKITDFPLMANLFWGVNIAIIILVFLTVRELWSCSIVDRFTLFLFISMFILALFGISPSIIIVASAILGISYKKVCEAKSR